MPDLMKKVCFRARLGDVVSNPLMFAHWRGGMRAKMLEMGDQHEEFPVAILWVTSRDSIVSGYAGWVRVSWHTVWCRFEVNDGCVRT